MAARSLARPPSILTGTRMWIPHRPLIAVMLAVTAWLPLTASASSTLHGVVTCSSGPTGQETHVNVPDISLSLHTEDPLLNKANASGVLAATAGWSTLTSHACSGGDPGHSGMAAGSASADILKDYEIVSATLPPGTPVPVSVRWAVGSTATSVGEDMAGVNTGARGSATAQVQLWVNGNIVLNISGTYTSRYNVPDGFFKGNTGTLNAAKDMNAPNYTLTVPVGGLVTVHMYGSADASSSVEAGTTDGDVQMAMSWGVSSMDPNASVVLQGTNEPAPPAAMATPEFIVAILPPRCPELLPCFRIPTQPADVSICDGDDATFTVGPTGLGPFTYQWRKDGVPIDVEEFSSAATATLSIMNVSGANIGSYDVVITNPCGDITSTAATLAVCVGSVDGDQAPRVTQLAAARPVPFRTSTTLAFDLVAAGDARLEVFDLRGARVRALASGWHEAGHSEVVWRGEDEAGHRVPPGIYFVRLLANGFIDTQRIVALP